MFVTDYTMHLLDNVKKIHFIGCGGSGMYPLIQILSAKGYDISGSDVLDGSIIRSEREMGVKVTLGHSQSPCWRSCWLSATDMTEIWSPCLPSPLKRTPESFSRARKTTGKFFAGTTLSWSIRLPPAEKTGNPNRTV